MSQVRVSSVGVDSCIIIAGNIELTFARGSDGYIRCVGKRRDGRGDLYVPKELFIVARREAYAVMNA